MAIKLSLITVTIILAATGCGGILRPSGAETQRREDHPDVKELMRSGADKMFTTHPYAVAVGPPRRISAHQLSACVKALVPGLVDGRIRSTTLLVTIIRGKIAAPRIPLIKEPEQDRGAITPPGRLGSWRMNEINSRTFPLPAF